MKDSRKIPVIGDGTWAAVVPFALITFCFALWGFANDVTTPLVKSFSKIFRMSVTEGTLVQVAFYGGYFAMAFPAAMFIRRYSYKAGVMLGLGLYALGAFLFFPAKMTGDYYPFLIAYFILTCGLSFLETSCNPYILSATRRLNLAQAFNPMGALLGMYVAMEFIQRRLHPLDTAGRALLSGSEFEAVRDADLETLIAPYLVVGLVTLSMLVLVRLVRMPRHRDTSGKIDFLPTLKRLVAVRRYREGVVAQFFYVGAQIMCWTFIIQYGTRLFMSMGMAEQAAEVRSQQFNIAAMAVFCVSRFICTFLLRFFNSGLLLRTLEPSTATEAEEILERVHILLTAVPVRGLRISRGLDMDNPVDGALGGRSEIDILGGHGSIIRQSVRLLEGILNSGGQLRRTLILIHQVSTRSDRGTRTNGCYQSNTKHILPDIFHTFLI